MGRMWRWCKRLSLLVVPVLLVVLAVVSMVVRSEALASLPARSGSVTVSGLSAPVTVSRDSFGVPRVRAGSLADACFAQGFVHAQERFVQMDAMRRFASGRLAEVFGASVLEMDRRMRPHGFERRADEVLKRLPERHRVLLSSYSAGVNEGLRRLRAAPPEYALLRVAPAPWSERDSLLLQYAMWDMLAMNRGFELMIGVMREALPESAVRFLTPDVSRFDVVEPGPGWSVPAIPSAAELAGVGPAPLAGVGPPDGRGGGEGAGVESHWLGATGVAAAFGGEEPFALGSNSFAVSGGRSESGAAILANDMHLPLRVPAQWFRVSLSWTASRCRACRGSWSGATAMCAGA